MDPAPWKSFISRDSNSKATYMLLRVKFMGGGRSCQVDKLKVVCIRNCLHFEGMDGEMVFLSASRQRRKES